MTMSIELIMYHLEGMRHALMLNALVSMSTVLSFFGDRAKSKEARALDVHDTTRQIAQRPLE